MRKAVRWAAVLVVAVLVAIQFFGPVRTSPATDPSETLAATGRLTPEGAAILHRSGRDGRPNATRWPWYSRVAPRSWGVIGHVNHGRRRMNLSKWASYDPEDARGFLADMCALTRRHDMPLPSYTWIHRDARLSDQEIAAVCAWTEALRTADR